MSTVSLALLVDHPLYEKLPCSVENLILLHVKTGQSVDLFCVACASDSVFRFDSKASSSHATYAANSNNHPMRARLSEAHVLLRGLHCSRDPGHLAAIVLLYEGGHISKIGEYPSRRDRSSAALKAYRKSISGDDYYDLNAAVGLSAHGVGAGAFVYLRRIFERRLALAADEKSKAEPGWQREAWRYLRMEDKIASLRDYLPESVVRYKTVYSVLSKGVHELSEDECRRHFGPIRACIEAILDDEIEMRRKQEREREIAAELSRLAASLTPPK